MRPRTLALALLLSLSGLVTPNALGAPQPVGYVDVGHGPTHSGSQGDGWTLVFANRQHHPVRYRACVHWLEGDAAKCWTASAPASRRSRIFAALFVNDRGGPGAWRAAWSVSGRRVASWHFNVNSEGV